MTIQAKEYGVVKSTRGCIVTITGLGHCINGQLVRFGFGTLGTIIGFDEEDTQVLILKEQEPIRTGDKASMTLEPFNVSVGDEYVGRIINVLGECLDDKGQIEPGMYMPIFPEAPSILEREIVKDTLETGIKIIDAIIPVGKGQRELILGDKMTGKTTLCTDIIINQKGKNVICIYCAIGKSRTALNKVIELFKKHDVLDYTLVVSAVAGQPPGQMYLAPYVASSMGEYFMYNGGHVLVIFDDFTKHAWAYREISLILGRPPGRESYPGDIFYLHSRMIERAARLNADRGGGSMTFLPIVELLEGDLTAYVPSNLVSMTDGQIYLSTPLFNEGFRPAIGVGLSVSRIGSKAQWPGVKKVSKSLRLEFVRFEELQRLARLKATAQSEEIEKQMNRGKQLYELLKQDKDRPVCSEAEVLIFLAYTKGLLDLLDLQDVIKFRDEIYDYALTKKPELFKKLREMKDYDGPMEADMIAIAEEWVKVIMEKRMAEAQAEERAAEKMATSLGEKK